MPKTPLYFFPDKTIQTVQVIKQSRFITTIGRARNRVSAMEFVDTVRSRYPDATHNCWAYVAGNPHDTTDVASNDDGDPPGTAGKPMLNVLQHKKIGEVAAVVTRYFGGIKLGTGGLVRAYSSSMQQAIEQLPLKPFFAQKTAIVFVDYPDENSIRRFLEKSDITIADIEYKEDIRMSLEIPDFLTHKFSRQLTDLTQGRAEIIWETDNKTKIRDKK